MSSKVRIAFRNKNFRAKCIQQTLNSFKLTTSVDVNAFQPNGQVRSHTMNAPTRMSFLSNKNLAGPKPNQYIYNLYNTFISWANSQTLTYLTQFKIYNKKIWRQYSDTHLRSIDITKKAFIRFQSVQFDNIIYTDIAA